MGNKNIIAVIDGEAGSCGKGKVIGEIATDKRFNVGASVTNCMPNAGHTFVSEDGKKYVFRNIPVSAVNPKCELFIGPGSAIDMKIFIEEYESLKDLIGDRKIYVHELVPLIDEKHIIYEKEHIKSGSTNKGCGAVLKDKLMRDEDLEFFKGYKNAIVLNNDDWLDKLFDHIYNESEVVLLEIAQGCDLSLNFSSNHPYVTSRNVSTTQMLSDSGLPANRLFGTIMVIRPFPIRISNITNDRKFIYTGGIGKGSPLTWSQINLASLTGSYPFIGDVECYNNNLNDELRKELWETASEISLMQVFGRDYKDINYKDITVLEALELERLYCKGKGISSYVSHVIDYPYEIIDLSEMTTVTKMERRIFDLDINRLKHNCMINEPFGIYLNFFQHLSLDYAHERGNFQEYYFNKYLREYFDWLIEGINDERRLRAELMALGTGSKNNERIVKKSLLLR